MSELKDFYNKNADFKDFVDKCMTTYRWTLEQALSSPITKNYYDYLKSSS